MFAELDFFCADAGTDAVYYRPLTSQEGVIFINTEEMDRLDFRSRTSIKDLAGIRSMQNEILCHRH